MMKKFHLHNALDRNEMKKKTNCSDVAKTNFSRLKRIVAKKLEDNFFRSTEFNTHLYD